MGRIVSPSNRHASSSRTVCFALLQPCTGQPGTLQEEFLGNGYRGAYGTIHGGRDTCIYCSATGAMDPAGGDTACQRNIFFAVSTCSLSGGVAGEAIRHRPESRNSVNRTAVGCIGAHTHGREPSEEHDALLDRRRPRREHKRLLAARGADEILVVCALGWNVSLVHLAPQALHRHRPAGRALA